jgi:hypothetical protein
MLRIVDKFLNGGRRINIKFYRAPIILHSTEWDWAWILFVT